MADTLPLLASGYSRVPDGKLAASVTCLEMSARPERRRLVERGDLSLRRMDLPDPAAYRRLYRMVGENWLWVSRLIMSDEELCGIIHDPLTEIYVLSREGEDIGLLELDFRQASECEIVFFGLVAGATGTGAGRYLMERALDIAWSRAIIRLWLHTCHFDSPGALPFYLRSGFRPYAFLVEVVDDPRLSGLLPRSAAPHVPLLDQMPSRAE